MTPSPDLSGRIALATGASRGIGKAIAIALATAGVDVAVNYRSRATEAQNVVAAIHALRRGSVAIEADVSHTQAVARLISSVEEALGSIDVLINRSSRWGQRLANGDDWTNSRTLHRHAPMILQPVGQGKRVMPKGER